MSFALFHAIEAKLWLSEEFSKKRNRSAPYRGKITEIISTSYLAVRMFHIKFWAIPCNRSRDTTIKRNLEKTTAAPPQRSMYIKIVPIFFLTVRIMCKTFCAIQFITSRDMIIKRFLEKNRITASPSKACAQKLYHRFS